MIPTWTCLLLLTATSLFSYTKNNETHLVQPINHRLTKGDRKRLSRHYPKTLERLDNHQPLSIQDIKNMTRSGVKDEAIIYEIAATHSSFFLLPIDEKDLEQSGVSKKVIEKMKSTIDARH